MAGILVSQLVNKKPPVGARLIRNHPFAGALAHWVFNEKGGVLVRDIASNHDGVLTGMSPADDWVFGRNGSMVEITVNSNDEIVTASPAGFNAITTHATLVLKGHWHTAGSSRPCGLSRYNSEAAERVWYLALAIDGSAHAYFDDDGSSYTVAYETVTGAVYSVGDEFFIVATFSPGTIKIYADGLLAATNNGGPSTIDTSTSQVVVFGHDDQAASLELNGISIEFGIVYQRALTSNEILELYQHSYQMFEWYPRLWPVVEAAAGANVPQKMYHYMQH